MNKVAQRIYTFLDNHLGRYLNPNGIEFHLNTDDTIYIIHSIKPPPEPYVDFGLFYPHNSLDALVEDFNLIKSDQLKTLKADHLWEAYRNGKVEIYCSIATDHIYHQLYFKLTKNNTMLIRDEHDRKHEIESILTTPQQFVDYTQNHLWTENQDDV